MEILKNHQQQNPPVYKSHLIEEPEASELLTKVGAKTLYNFGRKVKVLLFSSVHLLISFNAAVEGNCLNCLGRRVKPVAICTQGAQNFCSQLLNQNLRDLAVVPSSASDLPSEL